MGALASSSRLDVRMEASWPVVDGRIDGWWGVSNRLVMQRESTGALVLNLSAIHAMQPHRTG